MNEHDYFYNATIVVWRLSFGTDGAGQQSLPFSLHKLVIDTPRPYHDELKAQNLDLQPPTFGLSSSPESAEILNPMT